MTSQDQYLRAILATLARQSFPPARVLEIVSSTASDKPLRAYNLCDGSRTQSEIAKELSLDPSNLSKTLARWVDEGILIRLGDKREARPLHVYPLSDQLARKSPRA